MFPVVPVAEQLADFVDHTARWLAAGNTIVVHLFKNNIVPTPANVLADFTEVVVGDFPGYAPQAIVLTGTPFLNGGGNAEQIFSDALFQPSSDPIAPLTVYGYFVVSHPLAGADVLLYSKRFDNPPIVAHATDAVACDPDLSQVAFSAPTTE